MRFGAGLAVSLILVSCAVMGCARKPADSASAKAPGGVGTVPAGQSGPTGLHIGPLLASYIENSNGPVANFSAAQVKVVGNDVFVAFLFNKRAARYEGLAYLHETSGSEYTVEYVDSAQITHTPYTFHQIGGSIVGSQNTYLVTSGYVAQPNVLAVQIVYPDAATTVMLGRDRVYMDVQIGMHPDAVKSVRFLGTGNQVILLRQ